MKHDLKMKALARLAHTEGDKYLSALNKEADKIEKTLTDVNDFFILENNIELLNVFTFRIHKRAISIISNFLNRLKNVELEYVSEEYLDESFFYKYKNKSELIINALGLLERIRYSDVENILELFLTYSLNEDENIKKKSCEAIESLSEYNIDIIYGSEYNPAYGPFAQSRIIDYLISLGEKDREKYFSPINLICRKVLSPTASGTSSTYREVTWKTAAIPVGDDISGIRKKTLNFLIGQYENSKSDSHKIEIINTMHSATQPPYQGDYSDDLITIINTNILQILDFYIEIVAAESLFVIQKIEHDTYWIFKNHDNEKIRELALVIKQKIDSSEEYTIYKVLIGFEGIFDEWNEEGINELGYEKERQLRDDKLKGYAESINKENYEEWENRILAYSEIKSDDLATFPYFGKFLEEFSRNEPDLAIEFLNKNKDKVERFLTAYLAGLWVGDKKRAIELISEWVDRGEFIFQCARLFEFNNNFDEELINKIFNKAKENDDIYSLIQVISAVFANYSDDRKSLIENIFIPSIIDLTRLNDTNWVNSIWFRKDRNNILLELNEKDIEKILENLILLDQLDYHAEEILASIAENFPIKVIEFFGERLKYENEIGRYDAIPYALHELKVPLSKVPREAIDIVSSWYDKDKGMFMYLGANLLKIIFPDFPKAFESELINFVKNGGEDEIKITFSVLRNYEGQTFLHDICKELIKFIPDNKDYRSEIAIILMAAGTVSGEYGLANAYKNKKEEIADWLNDPNKKVREFSQQYVESLDKQIEHETKRADEDIALRKREYGE